MLRTRAALALLPLLALPLTGCGGERASAGSNSHAQAVAASNSRVSEAASSDDAVPGTPSDHSETYTCDQAWPGSVKVSSAGNAVTITWDHAVAPNPAPTEFTEYVVTLNRDDGNKVHMLYQQNRTDGTTKRTIWDADGNQRDIPGGDDGLSQTFPDALAGFGTQGWNGNATVNVDGQDVAHCS